jgi:hypothetical protein
MSETNNHNGKKSVKTAKTSSLRSTAHHEAGHAAANHIFGRRIKSVTIVATPDYKGQCRGAGRTYLDDIVDEVSPRKQRRIEEKIVILLAGPQAQKKFSPQSVRRYHASNDWREANDLAGCVNNRLAGFHCPGKDKSTRRYLAWLDSRAKGFVDNFSHWYAIRALAKELVKRKTIEGVKVHNIIRDAFTAACAELSARQTKLSHNRNSVTRKRCCVRPIA